MSDRDQDVIEEARERFKRCAEWENDSREAWKADMRFNYGDNSNNWQWSEAQYGARTRANRPCQTVNRVKQYTLHIINDSLQNKASIEIRAVGEGASFKSAEIMSGIVRHIEYISNAQDAYYQASHDQVISGIGYWRLEADYIDSQSDSFDQEIYIRQISESLSVYVDPDVPRNSAGLEAKFAFIFSDVDRKELEKDYPKATISSSTTVLNENDTDYRQIWAGKSKVRCVEYFRIVHDADTLHVLPDGQTMRESDADDVKLLRKLSVKSRELAIPKVEWFKIAGDSVLEKRTLVGRFVPIIRVCGTETIIDGQLDRRGLIRDLIGPQQSLNWYTSGGIEYVAMQTKSSWTAPAESIEGYETYWNTANTINHAVLPYKALDDEGNALPTPQRVDPPSYPAAFQEGRTAAIADMQLTSGMTEALMGDPGNERSGSGIAERQRASVNSTYAFPDRLANALRAAGQIIIEWLPHIYDTSRVLKILALDGTQQTIQVDPNHPQAHQDVPGLDSESISPQQVAAIFNPSVGTYDVVAEVGPQFSTRRQEAFNALSDIMAQNEGLASSVMDIWALTADFPYSDVLAERFRNMLPPQATGQVNPQVQELQGLLGQQHMAMIEQQEKIKRLESKALNESAQKEIDIQKARTDLLSVLGKLDPTGVIPLTREYISQLTGNQANALVAAHAIEQQELEIALKAMLPSGPDQPQ